jgi:hypothetical protein
MVNGAAESVEREILDPVIGEDFFEQRHQPLPQGLGEFFSHKLFGGFQSQGLPAQAA